MAKPICVVSSDIHLDKRAWAKYPSLEGDSYYGLEQLVEHALYHSVPMILAGDVLDKKRPDPLTVYKLQENMDKMEYVNLPVYYIQGQHELDRSFPWVNAAHYWPRHIHDTYLTIQGTDINVFGLDILSSELLRAAFNNIPKDTDILICHQLWKDFMGEKAAGNECCFADIPIVKMLITGDYHRHTNIVVENRHKIPMRVLSPGPVCMLTIDEDPNKHFFLLYDDLSVESIPLKTRQCLRYEIDTKDDLEIFLAGNIEQATTPQQGVPENIKKNIIDISYENDIPELYKRITSAIGTKAHLFLRPKKTKKYSSEKVEVEKRKILSDGGLEACLELLVDKTLPMYGDILSLLRSDAPDELLNELKSHFIARGCGEAYAPVRSGTD